MWKVPDRVPSCVCGLLVALGLNRKQIGTTLGLLIAVTLFGVESKNDPSYRSNAAFLIYTVLIGIFVC